LEAALSAALTLASVGAVAFAMAVLAPVFRVAFFCDLLASGGDLLAGGIPGRIRRLLRNVRARFCNGGGCGGAIGTRHGTGPFLRVQRTS